MNARRWAVRSVKKTEGLDKGEILNDLLRDLTTVIRDYGKEKGFTLIVEKGQSGVIYGNDAADLSKEILERYNTRRNKK